MEVIIPVSRIRSLSRALIRAVPAVVCGAVTVLVYPRLDLSAPLPVNRVVAYAAAVLTLPAPIAALALGYSFAHNLLLALWPGSMGVIADDAGLTLRLGPFGTRRYDRAELEISYPFERDDEEEDGGFEAYLPEEQQRKQLLPRIIHPKAGAPINRTLICFCVGDEAAIAAELRPVLEAWRADRTRVGIDRGTE